VLFVVHLGVVKIERDRQIADEELVVAKRSAAIRFDVPA
jgi:hypothetical protein